MNTRIAGHAVALIPLEREGRRSRSAGALLVAVLVLLALPVGGAA